MDIAEALALLLYLPVAVGVSWYAGFVIAQEEWWGDTRRRLEDWAYRDGDKVRADHPAANEFWGRARPVLLQHEPAPRPVEPVTRLTLHTAKPRRPINRALTVARTKLADMIGCPICSGWWGGLALGLLAAWPGPWDVSWQWLAVHAAGWGAARQIGWGTH